MMVIFGEYLGISGQAQEVWVGIGPCAAVAIEVSHNMVTCLYPPGSGFEMGKSKSACVCECGQGVTRRGSSTAILTSPPSRLPVFPSAPQM